MFTSQLKESHDREVTLKDIEPLMLEMLLRFAYTGTVIITQANMQSLMAASDFLQVSCYQARTQGFRKGKGVLIGVPSDYEGAHHCGLYRDDYTYYAILKVSQLRTRKKATIGPILTC